MLGFRRNSLGCRGCAAVGGCQIQVPKTGFKVHLHHVQTGAPEHLSHTAMARGN